MGDFDDIKSRVYSPEYGEGHERVFGPSSDEPRQAKRTRYVYRGGRMVELGGPDDTGAYTEEDEARFHIVSDLYMTGTTVPGPDGPIDIGSRAKRRAHMRSPHPITGEPRELADMADFAGEWKAAEKRRGQILSGEYGKEQRRDQIGRALYELSKRR